MATHRGDWFSGRSNAGRWAEAAAVVLGMYGAARLAARVARRIDFAGKVVVITGGSRGLGLILARQFGQEGARLVIAARAEPELAAARDELAAKGFEVTAIRCDVRLKEDVQSLIRRTVETYGTVDVLVNNAGVIQVGPVEEMVEQDFDEAMDVHFWGPLHAIRAVLPVMRGRGIARGQRGGRIINIASIGGKIAVPHLTPYCASKFALVGLSECLTAELRKDDIYITTVCPHLIRTGSPRNAFFKGQNVKEHDWFMLSDSLPGVSQSAESAAARIVNACRCGEPGLITGLPGAIAARLRALFPWLTAEISAAVNSLLLPGPGGIGATRARGHESESPLTRSRLTALSRAAAQANNEVLPAQQ